MAKSTGEEYLPMLALENRLAEDVREYPGTGAIADSVQVPRWKASIAVEWEKTACRGERRKRQMLSTSR